MSPQNNVEVKDDKTCETPIDIGKTKEIAAGSKIKWRNVIFITLLHLLALYGLFTFPYIQKYKTVLFVYILQLFAAFGVTGGVHRCWCHKAYKAKRPLEIFLVFCYLLSLQHSIYDWVRDHRIHHKFSETDADPHNSKRGFFFSHVGWVLVKKHPQVIEKGNQIDMSDIKNNPVLSFTEKHFNKLTFLTIFFMISIPVYFWDESWYHSAMANLLKFIYTTNVTWTVNSIAHTWGTKPYNKKIAPAESAFVSVMSYGEGWHNFHHTFPFDYRCPEFAGRFDLTAKLIEMFAKIGWAYDLRITKDSVISKTLMNNGDGSLEFKSS